MLEAARSLVRIGVYQREQYDHQDQAQMDAYLHVHGLGLVTHNYFGMLLSIPNTKPDTWIIRAVQRVADAKSLGVSVNSRLGVWAGIRSLERCAGKAVALSLRGSIYVELSFQRQVTGSASPRL